MIRKIVATIILVPLAAVIVLFAVANRAHVTVSFDPFASSPPLFSTSLPLFFVMLGALIAGVIIGGVAGWARRGKRRRRIRQLEAELKASRAETDALLRRIEAGTGPATSVATIGYRHPSAA